MGKVQSEDEDGLSSAMSFILNNPSKTLATGGVSQRNRMPQISKSQRKPGGRDTTPTNAYFDTYQKMNSLMETLQSTQS